MYTVDEIKAIVDEIQYLDWQIKVRMDGKRPYLQVFGHGPDPNDNMKDARWSSRKWWLSPHMCKNEIIRTAYMAVRGAVMHEMEEMFLYKGQQIFSPHMDYDIVAETMRSRGCKNSRDDGMQGV